MKRFFVVVLFLFCLNTTLPTSAANINIDSFFDTKLSNMKVENYTKTLQVSPEEYLQNGYNKFETKNYRGSIKDCTKAIEINQNEFVAYCLRALCEFKIRKYDASFKDCNKAIELNPNENLVYCLRSINEFKLKDYVNAIKDCNVALTFNQDTDFVYCLRALNEFKLKDFKNSISDCNKAIELNEKCYLAYLIRGLNKTEIEDFKGSMKDYSTAIKIEKALSKAPKAVKPPTVLKSAKNPDRILVKDIKKDPSVNQTKDVDFNPYMKDLQRRIKSNWNPPKSTTSKRVEAIFRISKSGELLNLKIKTSSGDSSTDEAAILAINKTKPFLPLPLEFKGETVDIMFTFDYKVFGCNSK